MNQMSMAAYFGKVKPNLTEREGEVLEVIDLNYPTTIEKVARIMRVTEHSISGRFTGLEKKGLIKRIKGGKNSRGNSCGIYVPVETEVVYENE